MVRRARILDRAAPPLTRLTLPEYTPTLIARRDLPITVAERVWRDFGAQIRVEFPSPATEDHWRLASLSWVGVLRPSPDIQLELTPRIPVADLFAWLDFAHELGGYRFIEGIAAGATLSEWFSYLSSFLIDQTADILVPGLLTGYVAQSGENAYLRGRLDVPRLAQRPASLTLPCHFAALSADIPENQLVLAALHSLRRSATLPPEMTPILQNILRQFAQAGVSPAEPMEIAYHSGNARYRPLHALCRMLLALRGPALGIGNDATAPFLVHMPRLFERGVARWLAARLPPGYALAAQESLPLPGAALTFVADLVVRKQASGRAVAVLDTKYTDAPRPAPEDLAQVATYAQLLGCEQAILVYPAPLAEPLDALIGPIHVRSATFPLDSGIAPAGEQVLHSLNLA